MRKTWLALVALLAIAAWAGDKLAWAADPYPSRQLTYLICFDPGGQSDREARRQQTHLTRIMGQKVLIDYKVGGGGAMGWKELVRGKPDGYLFAGFNIPHVILQPLQQEVGYKTDQIVPVVLFQRTPLALAVLKDSPYQTLEDFIKDAKANPGKLTVGGSAVFSGPHFGTMQFEKAAGVKLTYVPFTGSAPQMTAFLGGHTVACMGNSDDLVRFKDKLRVLAFATEKRFSHFPDSPTFKERGLEVFEATDRGVAVPPGTPQAIIDKLEAVFLEVAKTPEIVKEMDAQGFVPLAMGAKETKAHMDRLVGHYTALAKEIKK